MLQTLDKEGPDSAAFKKLHSATDLALRAMKKMAQSKANEPFPAPPPCSRSSFLQRSKRYGRLPPTPPLGARVDPEPAMRPKVRHFRYQKKMGPHPSSVVPDPQQHS
ncbi:hypothetical protein ROHU_003864 [Labeo rohita]|uniref:Uncharacterized protein n=1 Tax=Labeo rohita TaxID=84645 RepID=A0A498NT79_LABRO|nr:hypothetical protein ROHU_003864 [Labeo rohita]